jgi:hypothetical protein
MLNELSIWLTEMTVNGNLQGIPEVRLTHEWTAKKSDFFREAISVRKSLSCTTSKIRAWSGRQGLAQPLRERIEAK